MRKLNYSFITFGLLCLIIVKIDAQEWKPVPGNIMTRWATYVNPENVWKEYPRPQMVRKEWLSLNGLWDFEIVLGRNNIPSQRYTRKILVPFCVESALSGIKEIVRGTHEMMYRRYFSIPENWKGRRIILHFQAVDYYTKVWVDGKYIGDHKGGYDAFQFDITDALSIDDNHVINVVVWDPTNAGSQPLGKQCLPEAIRGYRYTPTSGIWQTVWLEPVSDVSIENLKILPDPDSETLTVKVNLKGWGYNHYIKIEVYDNGIEVASAQNKAGSPVSLKIKNPKLWSPEVPFLYDLKVSLLNGEKIIDEVTSYFGMRKVSLARDAAGFMRINLNNKEIFQFGPLDQGYWPDGILTPPSDDAIKFDIEYLKRIGCNMVRVHIKVHPERWYYYCDKLGILVWQDMVSPHTSYSRSEIGGAKEFEREWETIIDQLYNHPSIIQWTIFNEGWGQYDTERLTEWTKRKDPSRLVSNASGWIDKNIGDIRDFHDYTYYPSIAWVPKYYPRAMVIGEGGGFDFPIIGHLWIPEQTMPEKINRSGDLMRETITNAKDFEERYRGWIDNLAYLKNYGLNGVVYTQITDVEVELNGWLTYDREVSKISPEKLAEIHSFLFKPAIDKGRYILPLSMNIPQKWLYSFTEPFVDWYKTGSKTNMNIGAGPFGKMQMNIPSINTNWETRTLYLQKDFHYTSDAKKITFVICNVGISDIYINGEFAVQINNLRRWDTELKISEVPLPAKAVELLKKGTNRISIKFDFVPTDQPFNFFDIGIKEY